MCLGNGTNISAIIEDLEIPCALHFHPRLTCSVASSEGYEGFCGCRSSYGIQKHHEAAITPRPAARPNTGTTTWHRGCSRLLTTEPEGSKCVCMRECVYIYIYICMCAFTYTDMYVYIHIIRLLWARLAEHPPARRQTRLGTIPSTTK